MDWALFARGVGVGFIIAAPLGPNGFLCIRRTLAHGWPAGLAHGLGAATVHALYAGIAGVALATSARLLEDGQRWLGLFGGLLLCVLGYRAWCAVPLMGPAREARGRRLPAVYAIGALLTLLNPVTLLSFAAGVGVVAGQPGSLAAGTFLGSAAWWTFLSVVTGLVGVALPTGGLRWAGRLSGVALGGLGLYALIGGAM